MAAPSSHAHTDRRTPAAAMTRGKSDERSHADHLQHVEQHGGAQAQAALQVRGAGGCGRCGHGRIVFFGEHSGGLYTDGNHVHGCKDHFKVHCHFRDSGCRCDCCRRRRTAFASRAGAGSVDGLVRRAHFDRTRAAGRPRQRRPGAVAQEAAHHRQRDDDRGSSRRRRRAAADLSEPRPGRARHALHAHPRRGRPERDERRRERCAGADPHQ